MPFVRQSWLDAAEQNRCELMQLTRSQSAALRDALSQIRGLTAQLLATTVPRVEQDTTPLPTLEQTDRKLAAEAREAER